MEQESALKWAPAEHAETKAVEVVAAVEDQEDETEEEMANEEADQDVTGLNRIHALTLLTRNFFIFRKYLENLFVQDLDMKKTW